MSDDRNNELQTRADVAESVSSLYADARDLVRAVRDDDLAAERERIAAAIEAQVLTDTLGDELYHVHNDALRLAAHIARHSHEETS